MRKTLVPSISKKEIAMLTYGLFIIIFGFGGWVLGHNYSYLFPTDMNTAERLLLSTFPCVVGSTIGFFISLPVATFLAKFIPCRYESSGLIRDLRPLLLDDDSVTFIAKDNSGNVSYVEMDHCDILFTEKEDIYNIVFEMTAVRPCFVAYRPKRINIFGLFADFSAFKPKIQFVLPREKMIKKGTILKLEEYHFIAS